MCVVQIDQDESSAKFLRLIHVEKKLLHGWVTVYAEGTSNRHIKNRAISNVGQTSCSKLRLRLVVYCGTEFRRSQMKNYM